MLKALSRVQEGVKGAHKTYGEGAGHTVNVVPDTRLRESGDSWCGARASAEPAPSSGHAASTPPQPAAGPGPRPGRPLAPRPRRPAGDVTSGARHCGAGVPSRGRDAGAPFSAVGAAEPAGRGVAAARRRRGGQTARAGGRGCFGVAAPAPLCRDRGRGGGLRAVFSAHAPRDLPVLTARARGPAEQHDGPSASPATLIVPRSFAGFLSSSTCDHFSRPCLNV